MISRPDWALANLLKSGQGRSQVGAQNVRQISAFLHEDGRKPEPRDGAADAPKSVGGDGKTRERILLGGIKAERHDECPRRKGPDCPLGNVERLQIAVVAGPLRQGNIEIGAKPVPRAALMRIAPHKRIEEG